MKIYMHRFVVTLGILLGGATVANATILGFNLGLSNNTAIPAAYGSFASADATGLTVSNGTTPNIALTWDSGWDVHNSSFFAPIESRTAGGTWDSDGSPRIGQLDYPNHTISFFADSGYALVLESFDFGLTGETNPTTAEWSLTLTADSTSTVVWSQTVDFTVDSSSGQVYTITPNFTGDLGESYTLAFDRISETGFSGADGGNGRYALDNLSFNQVVAVPEPSTCAITTAGLLALLIVSRGRRVATRA